MSEIKLLRELLNLSQEQFARQLGTTVRTIQNWEAGKVVPKSKLEMLGKLASQFPNETFTMFEATDSPGAGVGNEVGISTEAIKLILDEMKRQRQDYLDELHRRDLQIDRLLNLLEKE